MDAEVQRGIESRLRLLGLLRGRGIEIGALNHPVPAPHLEVRYLDCLTPEQQLEHYQELRDTPLARVDILDDAQTLATLPDDSEDFVIANHVIEHMADPITALENWRRVLRVGGRLVMAVPDKHHTLDRSRELTPIEHLVQDREAPSEARDFETFREFAREALAKHIGSCTAETADEHAKYNVGSEVQHPLPRLGPA